MSDTSKTTAQMPDIQSTVDQREVVIDKVGVRRVYHPISVATETGEAFGTVGEWTLTVELPAKSKGTHMSRFVKLLAQYKDTPLSNTSFKELGAELLTLLDAQKGYIDVEFAFFVSKEAPVSKQKSLMDYRVKMSAVGTESGVSVTNTVVVPVMSLCPCSKEISEYGAHNQRSHVTLSWTSDEDHKLEDMIRMVEKQGSCELWALLKRPDEKYVTERSYENPKFVEDIIRDVAVQVKAIDDVTAYKIEVENFESIHSHSAYAVIESSGK